MIVKVYATLAVLLLCVARLGLAEPAHGELHNGYSAICAVARNEHLYIKEWIEYHLCLGIDKIYLYDHESDIPLESILLRDIPATIVNRVIVQRFKGHHKRFKEGFSSKMERFMKTAQGYAYWHCLQHYSSQHSFIGFIDVDEFLVITDAQALNINSILRDYEPFGGVSFHWRTVGSSGHDRRPNNSVVDSYTACFPEHHEVHRQIKSFVNTRFQPVMHSPHRALFRRKRRKDGTSASESHAKRRVLTSEAPSIAPLHLQRQNLSLREFLRNSSARGRLRRKSRILEERRQSSDSEAVGGPDMNSPSLVDEKYRVLKSGLTNVATWDRIAVYHYVTKSREDFEAKVERGGGAGVTRKLEYFDQVNQQTTNICTGAQDSRGRFCRNKGFALL